VQLFQHDDFYGIFNAMDGGPVIIRLLDPPLHESSRPRTTGDARRGLRILGTVSPNELQRVEELIRRSEGLREINPCSACAFRASLMRPANTTGCSTRAVPGSLATSRKKASTSHARIMNALTSHSN